MAYISQEKKASIAPKVKAICAKYGVKGSLAVLHHTTLVLNVKSGPIDFIANGNETCSNDHYQVANGFVPNTNGYESVNPYHFKSHYSGKAKAFLSEVYEVMNYGNHDNSDLMTDYFDVGWYVDINIGKWDKPYALSI